MILSIITTVGLGILSFLAIFAWNRIWGEVDKHNNEIKEMRMNYIDRFEQLTKTVNSNHTEISEKMHDVELNILNKLNEIINIVKSEQVKLQHVESGLSDLKEEHKHFHLRHRGES